MENSIPLSTRIQSYTSRFKDAGRQQHQNRHAFIQIEHVCRQVDGLEAETDEYSPLNVKIRLIGSGVLFNKVSGPLVARFRGH